ncbi:MAG: hypothetical protein ACKOPS_11115, partial [Cyanobium sp.]
QPALAVRQGGAGRLEQGAQFLAGNRLGLFTILVKPIDPQGLPCQRDHLQKLEVRLANWRGGGLS